MKPKLVSIAAIAAEPYIAVDEEGQVWRGKVTAVPGGRNRIMWEALDSEFLKRAK